MVKEVVPDANEITYRSQPPRSGRAVWTIVHVAVGGAKVVGIGTFPGRVSWFFYRGRELDGGGGLLQGDGHDLRFITLRTPADVERAAVKRSVGEAFERLMSA
jgi:hypothetical protein